MRSAISSAIWRASERADITRLLGGIGDGGGDESGAGREAGALDERAVGAGTDPAGGYHPDAPGDLPDEFGSSFGDAVPGRDEHYAYHGGPPVPYRRTWIGISEGTPVTRAVERAAHILLALASGTPRLGVLVIAELVEVPKPTVHTVLRTLERQGLGAPEVAGGQYALGPAAPRPGNAYLDRSPLRARSASWTDTLARQTGEAVWVGGLSGDHRRLVH